MSRAASEIKRWQPTSWQRLAVAAAVVSGLGLGLWTLRRPASSPPENHSASMGGWAAGNSSAPAPVIPNSTEPVATSEHPAQQGAVHAQASRPAERKAEGETTLSTGGAPQRPVSQRVLVSEKCVVDPKHTLSPSQRSAIVTAARMSGLGIVQGQTVRLVREGSHMIVETRNAVFSSKGDFFSGTLKGLLARSQQELPAEVTLRCPR